MADVAFPWESQSINRVDCSAAAKQAAKLTAVVVFPTPPFWFATAIMRAKPHSRHAQVNKRCVEMQDVSRGTLETCGYFLEMFHVEHPVGSSYSICAALGMPP